MNINSFSNFKKGDKENKGRLLAMKNVILLDNFLNAKRM